MTAFINTPHATPTNTSARAGYIYNLVVYDAVVPKADLEAVLGRVPDPTPPTPINCGTLESCDFDVWRCTGGVNVRR